MFEPSNVIALALKTSLLIAAAGIVSVVLARKSAAYRHLLWTCALALSLAMPAALLVVPSYVQIPVHWQIAERTNTAAFAVQGPGEATVSKKIDASKSLLSGDASSWIAMIWLAGAMGLAMRRVVAQVGLLRWMRRARPIQSLQWKETLDDVLRERGVIRKLRLREGPHVGGPCTWGFVRPVLLLPADGGGWSESQRRAAVLHEFAHIGRHDYLSELIGYLACALHWYNPLVWFAAREARKLAEQACDDAVLCAGETPLSYAQCLLDIAKGTNEQRDAPAAAIAMAKRSELHERIVAILDLRKTRMPLGVRSVATGLFPFVGLMLALATTTTVAVGADKQPLPAEISDNTKSSRASGSPTLDTSEVSELSRLAAASSPAQQRPRAPSHGRQHNSRLAHDALGVVTPLPHLESIPPLPAVPPIESQSATRAVPATAATPATPAAPAS